jgi:hypothetical protein
MCTTNFVPAGRRKRDELPWLQQMQLSFLSRGRTAELAATWKIFCAALRPDSKLDHAQNLGVLRQPFVRVKSRPRAQQFSEVS